MLLIPVSQETPFDLPGINLPLTFTPRTESGRSLLLPSPLDGFDIGHGRAEFIFTARELLMMRLIETITDEPDWDLKAFDGETVARWRDEISESTEDVTPKMIDWIISEVQWKAEQYRRTGIVKSYDHGVVKSDLAITEDLRQALREAVQPLEESITLHEKDHRPDSDKKVADLVDPSLFPFIYGRTKILQNQLIGLEDCLDSAGQGCKTREARTSLGLRRPDHANISQPYSTRFQWLPCDVKLDSNGDCRVASYINNLHPVRHRKAYQVIEKILTRTIPLWEATLTKKKVFARRIPEHTIQGFLSTESELEDGGHDEGSDEFIPVLLEPETFVPPLESHPAHQLGLQTNFAKQGLQVIIKLTTIELTPENPDYGGGSWHIEGLLNERICATAIYHYDSHNITDGIISFRHRTNSESLLGFGYPEESEQLSHVFGFDPGTQATQELGSVACRPGRLVTFPHTIQHRVSPFSLVDPSKRGHRKILVFFLVDPHLRVISTANVPPQREDWARERLDLVKRVLRRRLPVEIQDMILLDLDLDFITMEEAKGYRVGLMAERSEKASALSWEFETPTLPY